MPLTGNASLTYSGGTHNLSVPLQNVRPAHRQPRVVSESWDLSVREVYNIGSGAYEILADIRYEENPEDTIEVIRAGQRGEALTFADSDRSISGLDVELIEPQNTAVVERERDELGRHYFGTVRVRLRKTDGTAFPANIFH